MAISTSFLQQNEGHENVDSKMGEDEHLLMGTGKCPWILFMTIKRFKYTHIDPI